MSKLKLPKLRGFFLPPILVWTVIVVGSILIAQDAIKQGYISFDLSGSTKIPAEAKDAPVPAQSLMPVQTESPSVQPAQTPVITQKPTTQVNQQADTPKPVSDAPILSGANIFYFINGYRSQNGKPELQLSNELCQLAQYRANLMLNEDSRLEKSSVGNHYKFSELMDRYSGNTLGENVFSSLRSGDVKAIEIWKDSPPHNELMLSLKDPQDTVFTHGCVGTAYNGNSNVAVFLIGDK